MSHDEPGWVPTRQAIDALVALLPEMEQPTTDRWHETPPREDGVWSLPHMVSDPVENEFVDRAYEHGWVDAFDWGAWQTEAQRLYDDPTLLGAASLDTVRNLITTLVRAERFSEGTLRAARHAGVLTAILKRLQASA